MKQNYQNQQLNIVFHNKKKQQQNNTNNDQKIDVKALKLCTTLIMTIFKNSYIIHLGGKKRKKEN